MIFVDSPANKLLINLPVSLKKKQLIFIRDRKTVNNF